MAKVANPLLQQVLRRRRLRQRARRAAGCWALFGGLHIAVWWAAYERTGAEWGHGVFGALVWPLLLAATISFIVFAYYTARWFLAPGTSTDYTWMEPVSAPADPAVEPTQA